MHASECLCFHVLSTKWIKWPFFFSVFHVIFYKLLDLTIRDLLGFVQTENYCCGTVLSFTVIGTVFFQSRGW